MNDDLLLTFYGDDFTGSTDVLESLSMNGVRTILFFDPPDPGDLKAFTADEQPVQAIGVAGQSRIMSPSEMDNTLPSIFESLAAYDAELFHYKVCSTFDSSPSVGSIGHAIELGRECFSSTFVPVVVAAPSLRPRGRYVVFGNLFATVDGTTYRLDRHPTMSNHPVTPMTEADLARHLRKQTDLEIGLLDIRTIGENSEETLKKDLDLVKSDNEIVIFDGLNQDHQRTVGQLIWECSMETKGQIFSASSSGLNYALAKHWHQAGVVDEPDPPEPAHEVDQIVVMSGSAAPVTRDQIEWSLENGFGGVRLNTKALIDPDTADDARERTIETSLEALDSGQSVVCYTASGPNDSAIEETRKHADELGIDDAEVSERIGNEQGRITRRLLTETGISRVCVAGGDTSGYVAPCLNVYALEFVAPVGPGSPLCVARSRETEFDGLEIALKGGQVQTTRKEADYFGVVRDGGTVN